MGTDKRARQKEGRQARIAAAEVAQRKAARRQRYITFAVLAVVIIGLSFLISRLTNNDKNSDAASTATTVDSVDSSSTLESAAGKDCVAPVDPLPTGSPPVDIQVGPPPTSLVTQDIKVGTGAEVKLGDSITVNYTGYSCSTGKLFDSSYSRGQPVPFVLDESSGLIQGWIQGIPGMKVGGQRLLGIPSELAYGADGRPPTIAPDEALWFAVEVTAAGPATTTTTAGSAPTTAAPTP